MTRNFHFDLRSREMAFGRSDSSANGAPHLSLWATPQASKQKDPEG